MVLKLFVRYANKILEKQVLKTTGKWLCDLYCHTTELCLSPLGEEMCCVDSLSDAQLCGEQGWAGASRWMRVPLFDRSIRCNELSAPLPW